jgi:hypothetical protein
MNYALIEDGLVTAYPYSENQLREDNPNTSFPLEISADTMTDFGAVPVVAVAAPATTADQVAEEGTPELVGDQWQQSWVIRARTADELVEAVAIKFRQISHKRSTVQMAGWTYEFSVGTHTLDLRNADDKINWTLLLTKAGGMIGAGYGAAPVNIRTADNQTITIPATEARDAMLAFLQWGSELMTAKWALDEQVQAATSFAELEAIDIDTGWPV